MNRISELNSIITQHFNWNKARQSCFSRILQALFCVRTINLAQIATAFETTSKEESAYRRICRFFTDFTFDRFSIVPFILNLFFFDHKCTLILDRTNWKWGKSSINILMLSIAYKGISIPMYWSVLDFEGNSCTEERKTLLQHILSKFPKEQIEVLVADREFVGKGWFSFLIESHIPFIIRVKSSYKILQNEADQPMNIQQFVREMGRKKKVLNTLVEMWGLSLYLSVRKGTKGTKEPMILISNQRFKDPVKIYKKRWGIETLFGCMKTRGFRIEDTHVTDPEKIEKIVFVIAIAFCWAYRIGELQFLGTYAPKKSHGRKAKSIFRHGMDFIRRALFGIESNLRSLRRMFMDLNQQVIKGLG